MEDIIQEFWISVCKSLYIDKIVKKINWLIANIKPRIETYSCNTNKNCKCNKRYCGLYNGPCKRTTDFKYAKRTPLNYIKRVINLITGKNKTRRSGR